MFTIIPGNPLKAKVMKKEFKPQEWLNIDDTTKIDNSSVKPRKDARLCVSNSDIGQSALSVYSNKT